MLRRSGLIPPAFFQGAVEEVARGLLGQHLCREEVVLRITEVEAYGGPEDSASHARHGKTLRNAAMWGEGGRAYIYFCYGIHHMLNVVTGVPGSAAAVLIRSCEPLEGLERVQARRGEAKGPALLAGPGRVAQALGLDLGFNGHPLFEAGGLELREGAAPLCVRTGPRIGVDYAEPQHREALLRFADAESRWVTRIRELR